MDLDRTGCDVLLVQALRAVIAQSLGYSSESAFGNAFKRMFGRSSKRYWTNE